jgi:hypothetical protein
MRVPTLPVVIAEAGGLLRSIILYDTTLPREGGETSLGTRMRGKETWYLGSKEATTQVLGPEFEPIEFSGRLDDRRIGFSGAALAQQWLIELIGQAGRVVLFNYGPFVRRCRWIRHSFTVRNLHQVDYEIELQPVGDEIRDRKRVKQDVHTTPSQEKVLDLSVEVDQELTSIGGDAATSASGEMQNVMAFTEEAGTALASVAEQGAMVDQSIVSQALTKVDSARGALGRAVNYVRDLDWSSATQSPFAALAGPGLAVLNVHSKMASTAHELDELRTKTAALSTEATNGEIYIAANGDTLHSISKQFYGTPDRWGDIMRDNGKATPAVAAGEQLLLRNVPTRDTVTAP